MRQALAASSIGGPTPGRAHPGAFLEAQTSDSSPLTFASDQFSPSDWHDSQVGDITSAAFCHGIICLGAFACSKNQKTASVMLPWRWLDAFCSLLASTGLRLVTSFYRLLHARCSCCIAEVASQLTMPGRVISSQSTTQAANPLITFNVLVLLSLFFIVVVVVVLLLLLWLLLLKGESASVEQGMLASGCW